MGFTVRHRRVSFLHWVTDVITPRGETVTIDGLRRRAAAIECARHAVVGW